MSNTKMQRGSAFEHIVTMENGKHLIITNDKEGMTITTTTIAQRRIDQVLVTVDELGIISVGHIKS